jgi:hypothetical protein
MKGHKLEAPALRILRAGLGKEPLTTQQALGRIALNRFT